MRKFEDMIFPPTGDTFNNIKRNFYNSNGYRYISDGGNDAFDNYGFFSIYVNGVRYAIPLSTSSLAVGTIYSGSISINGQAFDFKYCWKTAQIFMLYIPEKTYDYSFYMYGNYGSDSGTKKYYYQGEKFYLFTNKDSNSKYSGDPYVHKIFISDSFSKKTGYSGICSYSYNRDDEWFTVPVKNEDFAMLLSISRLTHSEFGTYMDANIEDVILSPYKYFFNDGKIKLFNSASDTWDELQITSS